MEHTLNTLEAMLRISAEVGNRSTATDTALSVIRSMSGQEIDALTTALAERTSWCGRALDHAARRVLNACVAVVKAERELVA